MSAATLIKLANTFKKSLGASPRDKWDTLPIAPAPLQVELIAVEKIVT
jgi:hypothetical protein